MYCSSTDHQLYSGVFALPAQANFIFCTLLHLLCVLNIDWITIKLLNKKISLNIAGADKAGVCGACRIVYCSYSS